MWWVLLTVPFDSRTDSCTLHEKASFLKTLCSLFHLTAYQSTDRKLFYSSNIITCIHVLCSELSGALINTRKVFMEFRAARLKF